MKRKLKNSSLLGAVILFITVSVVVTVAILVHNALLKRLDNEWVVVGVMFIVILCLSTVCTMIDYFRRKYTEKAYIERILQATNEIAAGNFSTRLQISHTYASYNEYDMIMENFNRMAEGLQHIQTLHSDFISNVSHELKTPLAVLSSYAGQLQKSNITIKERAQYAEMIAKTAQKLSELVNNILKLNKLENQSYFYEKEQIRLDEMLSECVLSFEELIEKKNLILQCALEEVTCRSVRDCLEIVWNNLLSNAIKFTPDGGEISLSVQREGEFAVVCVKDSGVGISPQEGERIFEKFYQGDTSHQKEGNGLGLALVKKVIDVLGGEIFVESERGKGSSFTVKLKL